MRLTVIYTYNSSERASVEGPSIATTLVLHTDVSPLSDPMYSAHSARVLE